MRTVLTIIVALLTLCYPFAIYFGMGHLSIRSLVLVIASLFLLRLFVLKSRSSVVSQPLPILIAIIGLGVCVLGIIFNSMTAPKLYPVFVNFLLFSWFFYSLRYPPSVIERIARLTKPNLPPEAISYTRKTTIVWSVFFIVNALIALWTVCFASTKVWMLYNGFIAYILIALLFSGEFVVRCWVKKKHVGN